MPFYMNGSNSMKMMITDEDVEGFQRRLDTMIINFRSETLNEFTKSKKQLLTEQAQAIESERRRCTTMLNLKQNELEQLKESLAKSQKRVEDLTLRQELMSIMTCKAKTLSRLTILKLHCFNALKSNTHWNKHVKNMMVHRKANNNKKTLKNVFKGWQK